MATYLHNSQDRLSFLRKVARDNGLTFKKVNVSYNGNQAYALFDRKSGECVSSDNTLCGWYDEEIHQSIIADCK